LLLPACGGDDDPGRPPAASPSGVSGPTSVATTDAETTPGTPAARPHANRKSEAIPKPPPLETRGVTGGIADDQPAALADPRLHALGLRQGRVTVSWDLAIRGARPGAAPDAARFPALADEHRRLQAWLAE